ncbi:MAG: Hsp20/alpha crystallin family protein [Silicimonas sp.]|nr:Hsp20/alpha crystallin family protein [Silicimonas sp.]
MTRRTLPRMLSETSETAFFPNLQKEMNRLFDQFRAGYPAPEAANRSVFGAVGFPAIDVVDTDDVLEISAEVPGVKENDLDVTITRDLLTLKGEKSSDHEEDEENFHLIERQYGSFRRQIPLGFTPEEGAVTADFKDGILNLKIRKPANAQPDVQKISIGTS